MTDFSSIIFDNSSHTYRVNGKLLISGTTVVDKLIPPFDKDGVSKASARKEGKKQSEILAEWNRKGEIGREKGTRLHSYIEDKILDFHDPILKVANERIPEMDAFDTFWRIFSNEYKIKIIDRELVVGDEEFSIGGMVDMLIRLTINGQNSIHILDWKTGKFEIDNKYSMLRSPFGDWPNCHFIKYSLQVSLYRLIIERNTDIKLGDSYLVHLRPDGSYFVHRGIDFRKEILNWLSSDWRFDPVKEKQAEQLLKAIDHIDADLLENLSDVARQKLEMNLMTKLELIRNSNQPDFEV